jgi:indolepyruvate ferredoxin oxidoreductase beta subunit
MSHLRISERSGWSPQIPSGRCHLLVSLEPTEAIRVLMNYGNPDVTVLCNTRPVHAIGVISGDQQYPTLEDTRAWVDELSAKSWFLGATEQALKLGNPILGNIIMIGAAAAVSDLPMDRAEFEAVISATMPSNMLSKNLEAYDMGMNLASLPQGK